MDVPEVVVSELVEDEEEIALASHDDEAGLLGGG